MEKKSKMYQAVIWKKDSKSKGQRINFLAESIEDAEKKIKAEHGEDIIYTMHNEEDAKRPR